MSDEATAQNTTKKILVVVTLIALSAIAGLIAFIVVIGMFLGGGSEGNTTAGAACTPGDANTAGAVMPPEYEDFIVAAASESRFSPAVIAAQLEHESGFNPQAQSPAGAKGIAQFMGPAWETFGNGGDIWDPEDAIAAQGRYMAYLRDFMDDHARDEEHLLELVLAGYNAGQGAVRKFGYDLDRMFQSGGYRSETKPYVENIKAAAAGDYTSDCEHGGGAVPEGDIVEASMHLAWDKQVKLPFSGASNHGREAAKPEFVEASPAINNDIHTAYFTDCGVFVATAVILSGVDPDFPVRGTSVQLNYLQNSSKYDVFIPSNEGELQAGDILIVPGHIYIYTGERHEGIDGRAQGASLYTRPPSGHHFYLSDSRGAYFAARYVEG